MTAIDQKMNKLVGLALAALLLIGCGILPSSSARPLRSAQLERYLPLSEQRFAYLESFAHLEAMQKGGRQLFAKRIETRLPRFKGLLQRAASRYGLDWPLLAAISYQESAWDAQATSPTGVRGLMMLTRTTAQELEVKDRLDPRQSIDGGARYLIQLQQRLPHSVKEPDRTWMALAAYNMGMGHLNDARILARHYGEDPDKWIAVKEFIPLLQHPDYYRFLPNGHARGTEAVTYVERVRQYHTILTWEDHIEQHGLAVVRDHDNFTGVLALVPKGMTRATAL
jgi:membrane-bound lytic murein transglycosylase F